jgi:hypothetical protein
MTVTLHKSLEPLHSAISKIILFGLAKKGLNAGQKNLLLVWQTQVLNCSENKRASYLIDWKTVLANIPCFEKVKVGVSDHLVCVSACLYVCVP